MASKTSKVSGKGLTTIPKEIRDALGIEVGMDLIWDVTGDKITVKVLKDVPKYLKGKFDKLNISYDEWEEKADELIKKEI